jgi:tRNA (guanine-N7-)-methyltransferase
VQEAERTPEVDYLGIEWARQFWAYAADRVRRHGLSNVKLLRADAAVFVRAYVPAAVFRQVHIYFPDPWPKKRHHKRRLIQAPFLRELHRVLQPQGQVRIATDHSEYFAWMNEHIALVGDLFAVLPFESPTSAGAGELVGTNFERKYRREGRPFHALRLRKS